VDLTAHPQEVISLTSVERSNIAGMTTTPSQSRGVSRRAVLAGAAAVGAAVGVGALAAACTTSGGGGAGAPAAGPVTLSAGDIPVGGGKIFEAQQVVVVQPVAGTFKAFSAICTHQGCVVGSVQNGKIVCPCHNSEFSATDGSVTQGPAMTALAAKTVSRSGDTLTVS
jgi:nitrite reductase/ring-hydroxylating ferredoxin subunit